jgi:hypothetical protein
VTDVETYLASLAAQARGAGSRRLRAELRDHLDDAITHHVAAGCDRDEAARIALERIGPADELLAVWKAQVNARRVQTRRRAALVAFAAVTASALALVQHASGRQPSYPSRIVTVAPATEAEPPCASATAATIARPRPVPPVPRLSSARLNRSKARGAKPSGSPGPSSLTRRDCGSPVSRIVPAP